jgi:hypothetical protein
VSHLSQSLDHFFISSAIKREYLRQSQLQPAGETIYPVHALIRVYDAKDHPCFNLHRGPVRGDQGLRQYHLKNQPYMMGNPQSKIGTAKNVFRCVCVFPVVSVDFERIKAQLTNRSGVFNILKLFSH